MVLPYLMRLKGLEPSRITPLVPKTSASTNSATTATCTSYLIMRRKNNNYRKVIRQSLIEVYKRLDLLVLDVPVGADLDNNEKAASAVKNIRAIESEWILDKELLEEISIIVINPKR